MIISCRCLGLFRHVARLDSNVPAGDALGCVYARRTELLPPSGLAMNSCYRMKSTGGWKIGGAHIGHTRILDIMGAETPLTSMRGDIMVPHYCFQQRYQ